MLALRWLQRVMPSNRVPLRFHSGSPAVRVASRWKTIGMLRDFGVQHVRTHVDVTDPSLAALQALLAVNALRWLQRVMPSNRVPLRFHSGSPAVRVASRWICGMKIVNARLRRQEALFTLELQDGIIRRMTAQTAMQTADTINARSPARPRR
jgi:hypothetical protein